MALSLDGTKIAFTAAQSSVEIRDLRTGKPLAVYKGHRGSVTTIAFSPRGDRVATTSTDATVKVWDAATGKEIRSLKGTAFVLSGLAFSPDGRFLLTSCAETAVKIWDLEKGTESLSLGGHKSPVTGIAFNPAGTRVVTVGREVIRLWTWPEREEILTLPVSGQPTFAAFVADGKQLAAAGGDGATVWETGSSPAPSVAKK